MPSIAAVITLQSEGVLAAPSIRSALRAAETARADGLTCRVLAILDDADATTTETARNFAGKGLESFAIDVRDVGLARNAAIAAAADADFIGFLDGDDLWDEAWLREAYRALAAAPARTIAHPRYTLNFGGSRDLWISIDSENPLFDPEALRLTNYWTALSFAARSTYESFPYEANEPGSGWGYEDWNWNCRTLAAGCRHLSVEGGIHFVRRRAVSLSILSLAGKLLVKPTAVSSYAFAEGMQRGG